MTEFWGIPLNAVLDEAAAYFCGASVLCRLLQVRRPKWCAFTLYVYFLAELPILYVRIHAEVYPEYVAQGMRLLVFAGWLLICRLFTRESFWKILAAAYFADFFCGIAGLLRMFTCMLFEIPMSDLATRRLRWDFKFLYLFYAALVYLAAGKWIRCYRESAGNFKPVWKGGLLVYSFTLLFTVFTGLAVMESDMALFHIGTAVMVPLEAGICLLVMRMERSRRVRLENRHLRLQTSLFSEHAQVLKEQQEMVERLADWLEGARLKVPAAGMIVRHRARLAQFCCCENGMIDLAISNKIGRCEEQGIRVETETEQVRLPGWLKEIDLLTVLYNLFDNAARAAGECEGEGRYIRLKLAAEPGRFTVFMENGRRGERLEEAADGSGEAAAGDRTAGGKPAGGKTDDGNFREAKGYKNGSGDRRRGEDGGSRESGRPGRGQGLGIIAETVKRYHGEVRRLEEEGRYAVRLKMRG